MTTTHGGKRAGAGRKALGYDRKTEKILCPTERHCVTLIAAMWREIERVGKGNRSEGIRRIIQYWETPLAMD